MSDCPKCGKPCYQMTQPPAVPPFVPAVDRRRWRLCFWIFFLATPLATFTAVALQRGLPSWLPDWAAFFWPRRVVLAFGTLFAGSLASGFFVAKIRETTTAGVILVTIGSSFIILFIYMFIASMGMR